MLRTIKGTFVITLDTNTGETAEERLGFALDPVLEELDEDAGEELVEFKLEFLD